MGINIEVQPEHISWNYPLLDPSMHGKGKLNSKWRIIVNIDEKIPGALK